MIPDEAVEEAAKAILRITSTIPLNMWSGDFQERARRDARSVLDAAVPHIFASLAATVDGKGPTDGGEVAWWLRATLKSICSGRVDGGSPWDRT